MATERVMQRTLEGGIKVATGSRIKDQLAAIMEDEPETQGDEDLLAARWLQRFDLWNEVPLFMLRRIVRRYRKADVRRRRQEMAADGSYPWPTDEAERRQKRSRGGPP